MFTRHEIRRVVVDRAFLDKPAHRVYSRLSDEGRGAPAAEAIKIVYDFKLSREFV